MYVCDVCQVEKHASDGGKDVVKCMGCSKEYNVAFVWICALWKTELKGQ